MMELAYWSANTQSNVCVYVCVCVCPSAYAYVCVCLYVRMLTVSERKRACSGGKFPIKAGFNKSISLQTTCCSMWDGRLVF